MSPTPAPETALLTASPLRLLLAMIGTILCLGVAPQQASAQDAVGILLNDGRYLEAIITSLDEMHIAKPTNNPTSNSARQQQRSSSTAST